MAGINLVVSCTKRKTREPRVALRLRAVRATLPLEERASQWIGRLWRCVTGRVPARDLYAGDHGQTVRSIPEDHTSASQPVRLWVCSAGYGLVPIDARLGPYSATFAPGQPDSVCAKGGVGLRATLPRWWAAVAAYDEVHAGPRTIAALLTAYPGDFLLLALPDTYLAAVADDIADAARTLDAPERLAILSTGGAVIPGLEEYHLPVAARLSRMAGGTLGSLNARLARLLISRLCDHPLTRSRCRVQLAAWLAETQATAGPSRTPITDEELCALVSQLWSADPDASPTLLLRRLRGSGRACEQSRFMAHARRLKGGRDARP